MVICKIYCGLSGGFGGANYLETSEFKSIEEAEAYAYEQAVEEYQSYEGEHGIMSWEDCHQDLEDSYPDYEVDDEWVDNYYSEQIDSWIEYWAEEVKI